MDSRKILIIDDDINIGNMEAEVLNKAGYAVERAYSGTEAQLLLKNMTPDLILLDLMLPGINGEELLPQIKGIPVIVVSAKTDTDNKVDMLLGGAADYITKPFDTKELLARIMIQFRRKQSDAAGILKYSDITIDINSHRTTVRGQELHLTRTEYAILKLLMQNPDQIVTKAAMLDHICEDTPDCMESSLKVHLSNLRRKLREISDREYIESVWGIGFKMKEES